MECVCRSVGNADHTFYFWSTHSGAEIDLFWQQVGKNWGAELKYADASKLTTSMKMGFEDLELEHLWVIYPGKETYKLSKNITVLPLKEVPAVREFPFGGKARP